VPERRLSLDVLSNRPARRLLRGAAFPLAFQAVTLLALLALAVNGWGIGAGAPTAELTTLRKTNLTTLVVWGLWWPGMIAAALAFGRAWCTVCPMELANRLGDALGRRLPFARLPLGRVLRAGWVVVAAYLSLQLLVAGASIHRVPHYTALLLLALLGTALAAGLVFREPRSFCKGLCPASALLSVYGRLTPIQLDVKDGAACERCETKDCVAAANRDRLDTRSCPSLLRPFARSASDGCVLCLQCAKVCPHGNVGLGVVSSGSPLRAPALLRPAEAAFVVVASGFVTHELAGEVKWLEAIYHRVPDAIGAYLPAVAFGWLEAAWFLVLFPAALWLVVAGVARLAGHRGGARELLLAAATGAAPIVAVAHLAKALAKLSSWGGFLPLALRDPRGLDTLRALAVGEQGSPGSIVALSTVGALTLASVVALAVWSWARGRGPGATAAGRTGVAVTAALWAVVLVIWVRG
jgi:polyferredoxin